MPVDAVALVVLTVGTIIIQSTMIAVAKRTAGRTGKR